MKTLFLSILAVFLLSAPVLAADEPQRMQNVPSSIEIPQELIDLMAEHENIFIDYYRAIEPAAGEAADIEPAAGGRQDEPQETLDDISE